MGVAEEEVVTDIIWVGVTQIRKAMYHFDKNLSTLGVKGLVIN